MHSSTVDRAESFTSEDHYLVTHLVDRGQDGIRRDHSLKDRYRKLPTGEQETLVQRYFEIGPQVQLNDLLCCHKFDIMDRVQEIGVPTLAVCGDDDTATPVKFTQYLVDKIPGASKVIIEGATHYVLLEKPDELNKALDDFIKGLDQ